jgi:hypothetical protein
MKLTLRPCGREYGWCRGAESNCLRRPFQGRALPVSYLGTGMENNFTGREARGKGEFRDRKSTGEREKAARSATSLYGRCST